MTAVRTSIQTLASRIAYMVARYWGEIMTVKHRGVSYSLYVIPACSSHARGQITASVRSQELTDSFVIPRQTNFPFSDPVLLDDEIIDSESNNFTIQEFSIDSERVLWTIDKAVCTNPKQVGVLS